MTPVEELLSVYSSFWCPLHPHVLGRRPRTLPSPGEELLLISGADNQYQAFLETRMLREETVIEREKAKRNRDLKVTANCPSEKKKKG